MKRAPSLASSCLILVAVQSSKVHCSSSLKLHDTVRLASCSKGSEVEGHHSSACKLDWACCKAKLAPVIDAIRGHEGVAYEGLLLLRT